MAPEEISSFIPWKQWNHKFFKIAIVLVDFAVLHFQSEKKSVQLHLVYQIIHYASSPSHLRGASFSSALCKRAELQGLLQVELVPSRNAPLASHNQSFLTQQVNNKISSVMRWCPYFPAWGFVMDLTSSVLSALILHQSDLFLHFTLYDCIFSARVFLIQCVIVCAWMFLFSCPGTADGSCKPNLVQSNFSLLWTLLWSLI